MFNKSFIEIPIKETCMTSRNNHNTEYIFNKQRTEYFNPLSMYESSVPMLNKTPRTMIKSTSYAYQSESMKKSTSMVSFNCPFKSIDGKSNKSIQKSSCKNTSKYKVSGFRTAHGDSNFVDFVESQTLEGKQ